MRVLGPARLAAAGFVLLAIAAALWVIPSNTYIFLPNRAHPVEPLVDVPGAHPMRDGGGIYFVDVLVRKATLLERIAPSIHDGAELVPAHRLLQQGETDEERRREELREMRRSQDRAAAVALRELGYRVVARPIGARVTGVQADRPAEGRLEIGDVIVAVDGKRIRTLEQLAWRLGGRRPGEDVVLTVRRNGKRRRFELDTVAARDGRAVVGVEVTEAELIRLPLKVDIDTGNVGGPSAGLAFALDVLEELGRDVDRGYRVAATGSIQLDGDVGSIGGIRQKMIGVRRSELDIFLVPAGDNAREARRHAGEVRVIPVSNFRQALRALATLPRKRQE